MSDLEESAIALLSSTTIALDGDTDIPLYTVPTAKLCVLSHAIVVAGEDAGATTTITIGQNGATTDFLASNILSNLDAANDTVILKPIPNTTPLKGKAYVATTVIEATIGANSGGSTTDSTLLLFGILYDA